MDSVFCPSCGQLLPEGASVCPFCGYPNAPEEPAPAPPEPDAQSARPAGGALLPQEPAGGPRYEPVEPQTPDGGLTTAQYFWTLFLFAIPVLGLVLMLYWSFGSTTCPARQRLARASLIKTGVLGVLAGILLAVGLALAVVFGARLLYWAEDFFYVPYGYYDYYGYYDDYGDDYYGSYGSYNAPQPDIVSHSS